MQMEDMIQQYNNGQPDLYGKSFMNTDPFYLTKRFSLEVIIRYLCEELSDAWQ